MNLNLDKAVEAAHAIEGRAFMSYADYDEKARLVAAALIELMKPLEIHDGTGRLEGVCSCGSDVSGGNYCPNCGKRLKWK